MTIKELIKILQLYPQEYEVLVANDGCPVKLSISDLRVQLVAPDEPFHYYYIEHLPPFTIDDRPDAVAALILEVTDTRNA